MSLPGSISYDSPPVSASGAPFLSAANNGLSLSTVTPGTVVLGQDVGEAGNPAQFLSAREIPQANAGFNIFGLGGVEISQTRRAAVQGLGVHWNLPTAAAGVRFGTSSHDLYTFGQNGLFAINDVNTGVSCIAMKGQRLVGPLPVNPGQSFTITSTWKPDNSVDPATINEFEIGSSVELPNSAEVDYTAVNIDVGIAQAIGANGTIRGIWYHPGYPLGALANQHIGLSVDSGDVLFNLDNTNSLSRVGIQSVPNPSAFVEIGVGPNDGSPGTGQLKFQQATILTAPEDGVLEYDGVHLYFTIGVTRHQVVLL